MTKRFLVTGGAGFIGSHVTDRLLSLGHEVTVIDNFCTGKRENLAQVLEEGGYDAARLRIVEGSITDPAKVAEAFEGVSGCVHLAALPSVVRSVEAPVESHEANATGGIRILDAARQAGVRVVYAGSSSAYGDQDVQFKHEELRESPLSPYAATKLAVELYARCFGEVYDASVVVTRFFNVFGPRQVPDSPYSGVIAAFCFAVLQGNAPRIDGDGEQSRDFTYVGDVARGVCDALLAENLPPGCHTVNLACGGNHSVNDLLRVLNDYAGKSIVGVHGPARNGDVRHSQADVSKIRDLIGFESQISFEEGMRLTYDWYVKTYGAEKAEGVERTSP